MVESSEPVNSGPIQHISSADLHIRVRLELAHGRAESLPSIVDDQLLATIFRSIFNEIVQQIEHEFDVNISFSQNIKLEKEGNGAVAEIILPISLDGNHGNVETIVRSSDWTGRYERKLSDLFKHELLFNSHYNVLTVIWTTSDTISQVHLPATTPISEARISDDDLDKIRGILVSQIENIPNMTSELQTYYLNFQDGLRFARALLVLTIILSGGVIWLLLKIQYQTNGSADVHHNILVRIESNLSVLTDRIKDLEDAVRRKAKRVCYDSPC